jgi:hypothetical protein
MLDLMVESGLAVKAHDYVQKGERDLHYVLAPELRGFLTRYPLASNDPVFSPELEAKHRLYHLFDRWGLASGSHLNPGASYQASTFPPTLKKELQATLGELLKKEAIVRDHDLYKVSDVAAYRECITKAYQEPLIDELFGTLAPPVGKHLRPPVRVKKIVLGDKAQERKGTAGKGKQQKGQIAVFLGHTPKKVKVWWEPGKSNNGHLIIVGAGGAGKTELIQCIATALASDQFPVLMVDFHGGMAPDGHKVHTYRISEGSPLYFNPLELHREFPDITPLRATSDFIDAVSINFPGIGIQQKDRLTEIISQSYARRGITEDPSTWSSQLPFTLVQTEILKGDDKETQSLRAYLRGIFDYSLFSGNEKISIGDVVNPQITHIDLKPLPESLRSLYADLFLRRLYYALQTKGEIPRAEKSDRERFRLFVIVDEAKLLVSERQGIRAVLNKYATEMRKFGVGLILASQMVSHFNDEILANIATKICMNAETKQQAQANGKYFEIQPKVLLHLDAGQCFLLTRDGPTELQVVPSWKR